MMSNITNMSSILSDLAAGLHDLSAALVLFSDTEIETAESISFSGEVMEQYGKLMESEVFLQYDGLLNNKRGKTLKSP